MLRNLNVYTISAFVALGGLLFGFDIASVSGVIGTEQYQKFYGNPLGTRQGGITSYQPLSCFSACSGCLALHGGSRARTKYKEIEDQVRLEREEQSNPFRELFSKKIRKRVFLSMAIQIWSQLSGMNVMMYYIVYILTSAGIRHLRISASLQYVVNMVMTIPSIVWTDQWGRRPSVLVGALVMSFWLLLIGGLLMQYGEPNPDLTQPYTWVIIGHLAVSRTILACSCLAVGTFAVAWGPVSWIYPPEVVPLRVRAKSVSIATASNWATNFALGFAVPSLLRSIRWGMFFLFGFFNIAAFIHVLFTMPETKQRTLEEMDEIFEHGEPLWKSFTGMGVTDKLDKLAMDIEMGILVVHRSGNVELYDNYAMSNSTRHQR
ncbi:hypothetical protein V1519DRAFT_474517 [Lipomyces tetrasporus]